MRESRGGGKIERQTERDREGHREADKGRQRERQMDDLHATQKMSEQWGYGMVRRKSSGNERTRRGLVIAYNNKALTWGGTFTWTRATTHPKISNF